MLLLILSVFIASLNSVLLHRLPKGSDVVRFNMLSSAAWVVVLLAVNGFTVTLTPSVLLWGIAYGVVQELFMYYKAQAMKSGPVSVTTLIGNCSLVLSTAVGVLVWKEHVSLGQVLGIALLLAALVLCTYKKPDGAAQSAKRWPVYCLLFFTLAAGVGIIFKAFSKTGGSAGDMMLVAAVTMLVFSLCKTAVRAGQRPRLDKGLVLLALVSGLISCAYNRLNIYLAGALDSAVFYPCFNGGVICVSALLSMLMLRERFSKRQAIGLLLGICAVVTVGIF